MNKGKDPVFIRFIKGFIIGASMLVPGASGGTMAVILGIYDELIHAVSSLGRNLKFNVVILGQYVAAGILGIVLLSGPMLTALNLWNKPMMFLFIGAIIASIPPLYRRVRVSRIRPVNIAVCGIGALLGVLTMLLPKDLFQFSEGFHLTNFLALTMAGIIIAVALVLPGISASYILLMLGMYDITLLAIREWNLSYLLPVALGLMAGTYLCAGILEREMKRHPQFTFMLIIGFMIGSLIEVFPGIPDRNEIIPCIATFLLGFFVILWVGSTGKKTGNKSKKRK